MTLATSLFNKGIYKNTLRRFKWGSFIYFIMMFFAVPFNFMVTYDLRFGYQFMPASDENILFSYGTFVFPLILTIVVPTVVALLVYGYVHSGRHSIFAHSLPVTRISNYFSTVLAAFTLMFLPVIANALILCVMILFGYSGILNLSDILYWVWVNVYIIFIMFSISTFTSFLTGNSFAQVAINGIIHGILPIISLTIIIFSDVFLYGYMPSEFAFAERIIEYTPFVWLISTFTSTNKLNSAFNHSAAWIYLMIALAFYVMSIFLCKRRRVENCGEVAGFKFMKPILKYTITSIIAIAAFGILINVDVHWIWACIVPAFLCMIGYFACEMILNKTFKVFNTYKGYLAFVAVSAAVVCFFSFTGVFGFESRIPDYDDIESATIYSQYHDEIPFSSDDASKEIVRKFHKEFIKDIPVFSNDYRHRRTRIYEYNTNVYLVYNLKNGKTVSRRYLVPVHQCDRAISEMFNFKDYKVSYAALDRINIENIADMALNIDMPHFHYSYALNDDAKGLLKAIEKDMENITYEEYNESQVVEFRLSLDMSPEENDKLKVFKPHKDNERYYYNFSITINSKFKNAMSFLEEKGYLKLLADRMSESVYISKTAFVIEENENNEVHISDDDMIVSKKETINVLPTQWVKTEKADGKRIINGIFDEKLNSYIDRKPGLNYLILIADNANEVHFGSQTLTIPVTEIPDYLAKYID